MRNTILPGGGGVLEEEESQSQMSKAIITGDLHAHRVSVDNKRLDDLLGVLTFIFDYAEGHHIPHIFYLGDIFHNRNRLDAILIWHVVRAFYRPENHDITQIFLPGNHDWVESGVHTLEMFRSIGRVIDQPSTATLPTAPDRTILLVPFCSTREEFKRQLEKAWQQFQKHPGLFSRKLKPYLFVHQGFDGFKVGSDFILEQDLKLKDVKPERFDLIVSGHYHKHQHKGKLVYVGSPYQLNFGERTNTPGFVVLELGKKAGFEFVEIPDSPKFVRIERASQVSKDSIEGNFVQVSDEVLLEKVRKFHPRKVTLLQKRQKPKVGKRLSIEYADPLNKVIESYVRTTGDAPTNKQKRLIKLGLEIVEEAREQGS